MCLPANGRYTIIQYASRMALISTVPALIESGSGLARSTVAISEAQGNTVQAGGKCEAAAPRSSGYAHGVLLLALEVKSMTLRCDRIRDTVVIDSW